MYESLVGISWRLQSTIDALAILVPKGLNAANGTIYLSSILMNSQNAAVARTQQEYKRCPADLVTSALLARYCVLSMLHITMALRQPVVSD